MPNHQIKSPVVVFLYKRGEHLSKIFASLKLVRPHDLFLISDGPVSQTDQSQVKAVREAAQNLVSWPCRVHTNFAHYNLGLKERFRTGISWVFEHTDRAIFIEDDCLPDPTFFRFCDELLEKYKSDNRVITISGNNFQLGKTATRKSYYFSHYPHIWGWASWKRVWDQYDSNISDWPKLRESNWLNRVFPNNFFIRKFWMYIFDRLYAGKINTWDYQLTYLSFKNNGLNIIPSVNLVTNVGYGKDATNLKRKNKTINIPTYSIPFPLIHLKKFNPNEEADSYINELVYLHPLGKLSLLIKSLFGVL